MIVYLKKFLNIKAFTILKSMNIKSIQCIAVLCTILIFGKLVAQNDSYKERLKSSNFTLQDFFTSNTILDKKIDDIFAVLDTDQRASQLIMPAVSTNNFGMNITEFNKYYLAKKVGGAIFLKGTTSLFTQYANEIKKTCYSNKLMPAMISADAEPALVHYKFMDIAKMIPAEKQNSKDVINTSNAIIKILKTIGIQINFAPIADNNTNRAIIQNRSFGSNTDSIVSKCNLFMNEHTQSNIASTIKHFPGHGNVKGDTHKGSVYIDGELKELPVFEQLIAKKALGVMVAHITILNNAKWNSENVPATLSRKIVTTLLKEKLGFTGMIYTDALNMGAVSKIPNASFKSLCAGCDIALMPMDINSLHAQIKKELIENGVYKNQFEASIKKIIRMKICLGLIK
jgi:beta-N-acetylhexosaminidase